MLLGTKDTWGYMKIAITGAGTVSPIGSNCTEFFEAITSDATGVRSAPWAEPHAVRPPLFAAVDARFDPLRVLDERLLEGCDTFVAFGISACDEALMQAGLRDGSSSGLDPLRTAIVDGTSMGGHYTLMRAQWALETRGPDAVDPKTMMKIWANMTAAQLSMRYGLHGPSLTVSTACASSLDAIGQAAGMIRSGSVDVALCGGTEGGFPSDRPDIDGFVPVTSIAGARLGMESPERDPRLAMLPFDVRRSGIVFGEGAAWLVLESEEHARGRGARPLAWLRGYGSCADGHHPSSPEPTGRWESRAMRLALEDAAVGPTDMDVVVAHATGTPKGDSAEILAINDVLGDAAPLVTSVKGHTAHTGAASGAMSAIAAIAAMRSGQLNHTAGTTEVDPDAGFEVVTSAPRAVDARFAQINAFGFGGQNSSVVLSRGD